MKDHYGSSQLVNNSNRPREKSKHDIGKHATQWHRGVAERGTILRTEVGSSLHGTSVAEYDDRDEMGICIEPADAVIGFRQFEQYEWHSAWLREGGRHERSRAGDLDEVVYSLRKWMLLAMNGNPTVLLPLFAQPPKILHMTSIGYELREVVSEHILARNAAPRFAGYLHAQRTRMLSRDGKGKDVTRPELIERYGFDTKFAGHMIRLGCQGLELISTGHITLPMPPAQRTMVTEIRNGVWTMEQCLELAALLEIQIEEAVGDSPLPPEPNYDAINEWLCRTYQRAWQIYEIGGHLI